MLFSPLSPCAWRNRRFGRGLFLRNAFAKLCVRFCGWAWSVRWGVFDPARFLRGALAARRPGTLVGTLLQGRPAERCGCGCGVGTAVGNYTPSPSGIADSAAFSPARRPGPCVCLWLGKKSLRKAPVRPSWWEIMDCARAQGA